MDIEEVFIDPYPGCKHVVPGIVAPGGPPSPPLTCRWGASEKNLFFLRLHVCFGVVYAKIDFTITEMERAVYLQ